MQGDGLAPTIRFVTAFWRKVWRLQEIAGRPATIEMPGPWRPDAWPARPTHGRLNRSKTGYSTRRNTLEINGFVIVISDDILDVRILGIEIGVVFMLQRDVRLDRLAGEKLFGYPAVVA